MSTVCGPELTKGPVKLPYVLQRMRSLQNSCQQELENRQELISQLQEIQRENHALQFALSRQSTIKTESKSSEDPMISVLSANDDQNCNLLQLRKLISNNAKMRDHIVALSANSLYHQINSMQLPSHTKQELYEQLGIVKNKRTQHRKQEPMFLRDRSGFYCTKSDETSSADTDIQSTKLVLPETDNISSNFNKISPFYNFGFDMRFSNSDTYAFDNGEGQQIIERVIQPDPEPEPEIVRQPSPLQPTNRRESTSVIQVVNIFGSPLKDYGDGIEGTFDDITHRGSSSVGPALRSNSIISICRRKTKVDIDNIHWIKFGKLIELLTSDNYKMRRIAILTHTGFCDSIQLLSALSNRYFVPFPPNLCRKELEHWIEKYQQPVRFRVIATIKYWLKEHWKDDFADNHKLQQCMFEFCQDIKKEPKSHHVQAMEPSKLSNTITSLIKKQKQKDNFHEHKRKQREKSLSDSLNFFGGSNCNYILLTSNNITCLANCITELCLSVFMSIKPRELVNKAWSDPNRAPNLYYMIYQHELIVAWAQESILNEHDLNHRASVLDIFIRIAYYLSNDGNFHGAHAIYSAINMSSVHRLKQTFALLNKSTIKKLENLKHLFNYRSGRINLRNKIQEYLAQKCIPELSMLRKDLTFVEDGNESTNKNKNLINFFKCQLLAKIIEQIKMNQNQNMMHMNQSSTNGLSISSPFNPSAFEYIRIKIQKWKQIFQTDGDKKVWESFRELSHQLE